MDRPGAPSTLQAEIDAVLASPFSSDWLKQALRDSLARDYMLAAIEAWQLADLLGRRCDAQSEARGNTAVLREGPASVDGDQR